MESQKYKTWYQKMKGPCFNKTEVQIIQVIQASLHPPGVCREKRKENIAGAHSLFLCVRGKSYCLFSTYLPQSSQSVRSSNGLSTESEKIFKSLSVTRIQTKNSPHLRTTQWSKPFTLRRHEEEIQMHTYLIPLQWALLVPPFWILARDYVSGSF